MRLENLKIHLVLTDKTLTKLPNHNMYGKRNTSKLMNSTRVQIRKKPKLILNPLKLLRD